MGKIAMIICAILLVVLLLCVFLDVAGLVDFNNLFKKPAEKKPTIDPAITPATACVNTVRCAIRC